MKDGNNFKLGFLVLLLGCTFIGCMLLSKLSYVGYWRDLYIRENVSEEAGELLEGEDDDISSQWTNGHMQKGINNGFVRYMYVHCLHTTRNARLTITYIRTSVLNIFFL